MNHWFRADQGPQKTIWREMAVQLGPINEHFNVQHKNSAKGGVTPANVVGLQSLKQLIINVSYHLLVASLTLMALF